ncbi:MAG: MAPEG family protein [Candidatus Wenzhouxiangella sp. M2_3B_020]
MHVSIVVLYAALLALVLLGLSANVVRLRRAHRVGIGTGDVPALERAMRVHANFCEYVPLALILLVLIEMAGAAPAWSLHLLGLMLLAGRILHAWGLGRSAGSSAGRVLGTLLTWIVLLVAAGAGIGAGLVGLLA